MFGTIRKHSQALWIPIIIVIVVSFVIYFTPGFDPLDSRGGGITEDEAALESAKRHVLMEQALNLLQRTGGFFPPGFNADAVAGQMRPHNLMGNDFQTQQQFGELDDYPGLDYQAQLRMQRLNKARAMGIVVGHDSVVARIESGFTQPGGSFSRTAYENFLKPLKEGYFLSGGAAGEAQFEEFIREDLILGQLDRLMTRGSGFFPDHAVATTLAKANQQYTARAVFFSSTNNLAEVTKEADANGTVVTEHYPTVANRYFIEPKRLVGYVKIGNAHYLPEAEQEIKLDTLVTNRVQLHHSSTNVAQIFKDANGTKLPDGPELNAAARAAVRETHKLQLDRLTQGPTKTEADKFSTQLFDNVPEENWTLTRLRQEAAKWDDEGKNQQPLTYRQTAVAAGNEDDALPDSVVSRVFESFRVAEKGILDERLIEEPGDGYYFIGYVDDIPGRPRTFGELNPKEQAEVKQSYIQGEVARRNQSDALDYRESVQDLMKTGRSFADIVQDANGTFPSVPLPAMKLNGTNLVAELDGYALLSQVHAAIAGGAGQVKPGWISPYTPADNAKSAGFIVHVSKVSAGLPPSPVELQRYAEYLRQMARSQSSSQATARYGSVPAWLSQEVEVMNIQLAMATFLKRLADVEYNYEQARKEFDERAETIRKFKDIKDPGIVTIEDLQKDQQEALVKLITLRSDNAQRLPEVLKEAHQKYVDLTGDRNQYAEEINAALAKAREFERKLKTAEKQ